MTVLTRLYIICIVKFTYHMNEFSPAKDYVIKTGKTWKKKVETGRIFGFHDRESKRFRH